MTLFVFFPTIDFSCFAIKLRRTFALTASKIDRNPRDLIWYLVFFLQIDKISELVKFTRFQCNEGSGLPLGGPHSSNAVSPAATRVSFGSTRKSSRKTAN